MSYRASATLFCAFYLVAVTSISAQEKADQIQTVEKGGVKVEMSLTSPDGKPVAIDGSPVKIRQSRPAEGQPNKVEFSFETANGNNLFASTDDERTADPTTMRQVRIGDYKTDGVLLAGDMWRSMKKWGVAGLLGSIKLATFKAGQSAAAFAKANGISESDLRLMNPLVEFEKIRSDTPVCIDATHRVMPGETLEFLANLHQTNTKTLSELNGLDASDVLDWRLIKVPAVTEKGRSGFSFYTVKYSPKNRQASFNSQDYVKKEHKVLAGENLSSIAMRYGASESMLRQLNGLDAESGDLAGRVLIVKSEIDIAANGNVSHLVNELESKLRLRLEDVLQLNDLQSPNEFAGMKKILIPAGQAKRN